ncbi:hypothetical protein MNBD_ALPHA06-162 [hydrothermal vent metagenome]|uniref:Uncharacterized protein n=1 Tax=hydrothermal vent metagenome TaxID=652676 RepID=A0A3B0RFM2_9ZZZZ
MKTTLIKTSLTALLAISALGVSIPAMADVSSQYQAPQSRNYARTGYRAMDRRMDRRYDNQRRISRTDQRADMYGYGAPRSWRQVRGRIVAVGRGAYSDCFRVQRKGKYRREPAIVSVRYCENAYGDPVKMRGTTQLIRYTQPMYSRY